MDVEGGEGLGQHDKVSQSGQGLCMQPLRTTQAQAPT